MIRSVLRCLWLRCPRCGAGRLFRSFFHMRRACPHCQLPFERAGGEITGGMAINLVVTLLLALGGGIAVGVSVDLPIVPAMLALGVGVLGFSVLFYPFSRALWVACLYLTGDNNEPDSTIEE